MPTPPVKPLATRERLSEVRYEIRGELARRARELEAQGQKLIKLNIGNPGAFGFRAPEHLQRAIADDMGRTDPYTHQQGLPSARDAIAAAYAQRGTPDAHPDRVFVGNGVSELIDLSLRALLNPGDEVLVPAPYWLSYPDMVMLTGATPVSVLAGPEQGFKVTPAMLEAHTTDKTKLLILNSPSNPTGAVYTEAEFTAIMDWAIARGLFVLSDEIYDQLVFAPAKMTSAIGWFAKYPEQVAVLNGLSKSYAMTGWRVGFLAAHPTLIKKISAMQGHSTSNICSIAQKAGLAALTGSMECVDKMREAFVRRRDFAMKIIEGWPFAICPKPDGAFYLFLDVSKCYGGSVNNSTDLCTLLLDKAHVAVVPGAAFGDDKCIRFSYAVGDDVLKGALESIGAVLAELAAEPK